MIPFIQTTLDGLMVGSSYGLLALGFALIFGVMRRLNLSYGPSIMVGAYLGTLLYMQFGAPTYVVAIVAVAGSVMAGVYVGGVFFSAVFFCSAGGWRGVCLDGCEFRNLDATRTSEPADVAASQLSVPVADQRRVVVCGTARGTSRLSHHAGRDAGDHSCSASVALSHTVRPRIARHHREQRRCKSVRDRCPQYHAQGLRAGVGDRWRRRLSRAVGQSAGDCDARDVGNVERADRHD